MQLVIRSLSAILLAGAAIGQGNLLTNPDFEALALSPWTHNGNTSHSAAVETYDVAGTGKPSKAIACTPYTTTFAVRQSVTLVKDARYRFTMNLASYWPNPNNANYQSDAGQFSVFIGTTKIASTSLGVVYASAPTIRRSMSGEFQATATGAVTVSIEIRRSYAGKYGQTPRCYVDTVTLSKLPPKLQVRYYGYSCRSIGFAADLDSTGSKLTQTVVTMQGSGAGLMILGNQTIQVPFLGCTLLTNGLALFPYTLTGIGLWRTDIPVPKGYTGPVHIQHLVQLPGGVIGASKAARIAMY